MNQEQMQSLMERISAHNPALYPLFSLEFGDAVVGTGRDEFLETVTDLRAAGFDRLVMVTAIDRESSFVLVYRLYSRSLSTAIVVKVKISQENPWMPSTFGVWPAALWQEREVYDLFGIEFRDHPDLRRILLPDDFAGHPLRKDYDDDRMIRRPDYI